jgi:hypothetical protein
LGERLSSQLACSDLIERLLDVVRSMDKGTITVGEALEEFTRNGLPSFSQWLVDMVDEGVYLDTQLQKAA